MSEPSKITNEELIHLKHLIVASRDSAKELMYKQQPQSKFIRDKLYEAYEILLEYVPDLTDLTDLEEEKLIEYRTEKFRSAGETCIVCDTESENSFLDVPFCDKHLKETEYDMSKAPFILVPEIDKISDPTVKKMARDLSSK